jgi:glycosyltransferase involved in cell wall biosynthesis
VKRPTAIVMTPRPPWPLDDGGRIALWQIVWSMARAFDTVLFTMHRPAEPPGPLPDDLARLGVRLVAVPHEPAPAPLALVQGLVGRWPYTLARFRSDAVDRELRRVAAEVRPRVCVLNNLHLGTYAGALRGSTVVLRQQNVETIWLERYSRTLRGPARWYAAHQAARMRRAEARLCEEADLVLAIQDEEAAALRALSPRARVEMIPVGVDFGRFRPHRPAAPPVVLITGAFGWPPNESGARKFLADGWPRVRARVPNARLRLVGKGLGGELRDLAIAAGAEAVGYVDDIAVEFAEASALVVPLWAGAGMRVKIVEAMAAGLPVVATSLAAEGIGLRSGIEAELAESAEELGLRVAGLLEDPGRAGALAAAAHAMARERYSIEALGNRLVELCEEAARRREAPATGARE